jgi:F-type H+-transporting ATPase subunit delta
MQNVSVARRYARALLDASEGQADAVLSQLEQLVQFFAATPDVFAALSNPALSRAQRHTLTEKVIASIPDLHRLLANVLKLLTDRNRFQALPVVAVQFRELVDSRMGRVRGTITSAVRLDDAQRLSIGAQLETLTQRKVVLETHVDPSLLGGVVATVGNRTFDGSLRSQLQAMGRELTEKR